MNLRIGGIMWQWFRWEKLGENLPLYFGLIVPLLFIATDLITGAVRNNYNFISQSMSELSAAGSPARPYLVAVNIIGYILLIIFGWTAFKLGQNWALHTIAVMLIFSAILNLIWIFFPMHLGQTPSTINVIFGALSVFSLVLAIPLGAFAFGGWFRIISIAITIIFISLTVFGLWIAKHPANNPASTVGLQERTMSYLSMLWLASLAVRLLQVAK